VRVTHQSAEPGTRVFCNGIEFGASINGWAVITADEEERIVEAVRVRDMRRFPSNTYVPRFFVGTVKILVPQNGRSANGAGRAR
jgi:hypothetical protein